MTEKSEYVKKWCKYDFTDEEKKEIAEELAIKTQQLDALEDEKKAVMSSYKEQIERLQSDVKGAATRYKDGYEMRDIECEVIRDFEDGTISFYRTDNGARVRVDKMTVAERQMKLTEAATVK